MKKNISPFLQILIETAFFLLFFLLPLILCPLTTEIFEFNKMVFIYFLTILIGSLWLARILLERQLIFRRSFLDLPHLFFLISQVLATVFSLHPTTSFWGYPSRLNGGLLSTLVYLLLFYAFHTHFRPQKIKKLFLTILASGTLTALYGLTQHFGIDAHLWLQDVQNRVFATLGQPNWLAAYLDLLLFLTLGFISASSKKSRGFFFFLFFIFFLCLLYTKSRSGLLGLFLPLPFFLAKIEPFRKKTFFSLLFPLSLIIILTTFSCSNPLRDKIIPPALPQASSPEESSLNISVSKSTDIRKIVWQGALKIWQTHPLLGTGPETFAYSYYQYRPAEHNLLSEWDFLYNKAHNEFLNYLANTGLFGLAGYLTILLSSTYFFLKHNYLQKTNGNPLNLSLQAGYLSLAITNFSGFSTSLSNLFLFLIPAFSLKLNQAPLLTKKSQSAPKSLLLIFPILLCLFFSGQLIKIVRADYYLSRAEADFEKENYSQSLQEASTAVFIEPQNPRHHERLSLTAAKLAAQYASEAEFAQKLTDLAIRESDFVIRKNPYHLNFLKNRTQVFVTLAEIDPKYRQQAIATLLYASGIAPTDAKIFYNLALLYGQEKQADLAISTLEKTIQLKSNYKDAYFALALFYQQAGQKEKARSEIKYILNNIDPQDSHLQQLLLDWQD